MLAFMTWLRGKLPVPCRQHDQVQDDMPDKVRPWITQIALALLGVGLGLFLGWLAIRGTDWTRVKQAMGQFPPSMLILALVLLVISAYLRAARWRLLWITEKVSTLRLFWVENAALGLNNLSPVRALDEPVELGILTLRDRLPVGTVAATIVVSRILDLVFTLLFVTAAVASLPALLQFTPAIALTALYLFVWLLLLLNIRRIVEKFPGLRRLRWVTSFEDALAIVRLQRRRLIMSFGLTAVYWLILGPVGWAVAAGTGIDVAFHHVMFVVMGSIFFATAIPGLPGAIGTFEFAAVSLLAILGVPREDAVTFAIVLHVILVVPQTLVTIVVLPREGLGSIKALRELIRSSREARRV